jgi:DNA polymerase-1
MTPRPHVAFDLETHDSSLMHRMQTPEFFRVGGYSCTYGEINSTDVRITTSLDEIVDNLRLGATVTGHNILTFDLLVLARLTGIDIIKAARRGLLRDTMLTAFLDDPPPARMNAGQVDKYYSLDSVSDRLLGLHKAVDVSKQLVREWGGWGSIPVGDPRFHAYLNDDVVLTGQIRDQLCGPNRELWPYAEREHTIAALCAVVTLNGFRVDHAEVMDRVRAGEQKRAEILERLVRDHGLPTTRKDGGPSTAPQNTQAGREAVKRAFEALGCKYMPKTDKGAWATGKEDMNKMAAHYGTAKGGLPPDRQRAVRDLCETIQDLNGIRTVYETVAANMVPDADGWRVHPTIALRQASGRLSFSKPGLTVMGKRGGRHHEREIFIPEPGHVIVAADLSQVDARAVAVLCQDPGYMKMFEPGRDLHSEIAIRVFGTKAMREQAKVAGHGFNYGLGAPGMVEQMGIDEKVAFQFVRQMREQFPRLNEWKNEMAEAASSGRMLDNGFGRKMRPDRHRAFTQGPALCGQGCARDLLCEGLLRLPTDIHPLMRGIVHDELVLSVPESDAEEVEKIVLDAMSFEWVPPRMPNARPIRIEAGVGKRGKTWGHVYAKD